MDKFRVYCKTEPQARKVLEKMEQRGLMTAYGKTPTNLEPREVELLVNNGVIFTLDCPRSSLISVDVSEFKEVSVEDYLNDSFTKKI